jgi:hypothetical protein
MRATSGGGALEGGKAEALANTGSAAPHAHGVHWKISIIDAEKTTTENVNLADGPLHPRFWGPGRSLKAGSRSQKAGGKRGKWP